MPKLFLQPPTHPTSELHGGVTMIKAGITQRTV
jgi:hypothetical protein